MEVQFAVSAVALALLGGMTLMAVRRLRPAPVRLVRSARRPEAVPEDRC